MKCDRHDSRYLEIAGATGLEAVSFPTVLSGRAVIGQRSVDNRKSSQTFSSASSSNTDFFSADPDAKHICNRVKFIQSSRAPASINFSRYIIIIKVVRSLERKIDERLRSSTRRIAANR